MLKVKECTRSLIYIVIQFNSTALWICPRPQRAHEFERVEITWPNTWEGHIYIPQNLPDDKLKVRQIYQLKQLSCLDKTTYISHLIYLTKYAFKRQLKVSVYRCTTNGGTVLVLISLREWDDNVSFSIFIFTIYIDSLIYYNQPCLLIIYQSAVYKCILLPVAYRVCTYESKFTGSGNFGWATP